MARNTNCLENIQCPECRNESHFKIAAVVIADVRDDGAEFHGDAEWHDNSAITCPECDHSGNVGEFRCRTVNVHIYREMRLRFDGLRAASETADCYGKSFRAIADVVGHEDLENSQWIEFEPARKLRTYRDLVDTLLNIKRRAEKAAD